MSRMLLVHGWAFDPALWQPLRAALPGHAWFALDLGYFGPARLELPPALDLVVGHSFGCLWAMAHPDLAGIPLVAVNGFPRFTAAEAFPHGTPPRVLERMLRRLQDAPGEVLEAFHARCGTALRAFPARQPILACAAEDDPLVAPALARQAFARGLRMLPGGGHALPLTRPGALARVIREGLEA